MRVGRGGASSMPPQHRNSIEMSAPAEWKPYARRAITRSLLLMPSTGRRQPGPRSPLQPLLQQLRRIPGRRLTQDRRQILLQFVGPVQRPVLTTQRLQTPGLAGLQPPRVLQQRITRPLQRLRIRRVQAPLLRTPHLVNRIRRKPLNVKSVEHHPRMRNPSRQRLLPARRQVRRHQLDPRAPARSQLLEEGPQRLRAATLPGPHHPTRVMVNHERQIPVTLPVAELVDADSLQLAEPSPVQPPRHHPFHDVAHRHPLYPQQAAHRRPVHHLRQIRRQLLEPRREHAAAARPRHLLRLHPATRARHPPRRVLQPTPPSGPTTDAATPEPAAGHTAAPAPRTFRTGNAATTAPPTPSTGRRRPSPPA